MARPDVEKLENTPHCNKRVSYKVIVTLDGKEKTFITQGTILSKYKNDYMICNDNGHIYRIAAENIEGEIIMVPKIVPLEL
jgi:membrane protease subunit (stomatin/prohibitin family)